MRARLVLGAAAITLMVALAFLVPLLNLVEQLARDRALGNAEREAQAMASAIALSQPNGREASQLASQLVGSGEGLDGELRSIILPNDTVFGAEVEIDEVISVARQARSTFTESVPGGAAVLVPVVQEDEAAVVVRVFVPTSTLRANVDSARVVLIALAVILVGLGSFVADGLGRSVTEPVKELSRAAHRLAEGELSVRVEPAGPPEIFEVGRAFNLLAERIGRLLETEREAIADVSHRLRTPLTALRLDVDGITDTEVADRIRDDVEAVERTVDAVIREARRPARQGAGSIADVAAIVRERASFWGLLAAEQERRWTVSSPERPVWISGTTEDVAAGIDALIGNVFAHTPDGTPFTISVHAGPEEVSITLADRGPGFTAGSVERGTSGAGSTGLGLDIVQRTAQDAGGTLTIEPNPGGGALIRMVVPRVT